MNCQYKDIFGKVGEGVHSIRLFNIAVVDVVATILSAYGLHRWFQWNFWITLCILFVLGIALHRFFCVRTTVDKLLF